MTCIAVDDNQLCGKEIEQLVKFAASLKYTGIFNHTLASRLYLQNKSIDCFFIDVDVNEDTRHLMLNPTSHSEVKSVASGAPVAFSAHEVSLTNSLADRIETILKHNLKSSRLPGDIFVQANNQLQNIRLTDIQFIETSGGHSLIHTRQNQYTVSSTTQGIQFNSSGTPALLKGSHFVYLKEEEKVEEMMIIINRQLISSRELFNVDFLLKICFQ